MQETAKDRLQNGGAMDMVKFLLNAPPAPDDVSNTQRVRRRRTFSELERGFACPNVGCE
eukprot:Ihof_evm3s703 gene=Ihof_evmTU3s703